MLTANSSAEILPFQPNQPTSRKGSFEAWKESWVRAVFADEDLWGSDKSIAAFLAFHLNRETRTCFPSYSTIGRGLGINRSNARRSIRRLIARGYLRRERRGRGQSNVYCPAGGVVTMTTRVVTVTTPGVVTGDPLTSESLTSDSTLKEGVVTVTTGKEEKERGNSREARKEEKKGSEALGSPFLSFKD
jgi:Helix-turn-helix domain